MRTPSALAVSYFFAMSMIVASSCKKDDKPEEEIPLTATEVKDIAADPTANDNHYAFYSLETGKAIAVSDSASSKWDIAFRSTTIITNGGASGPGAGGTAMPLSLPIPFFVQIMLRCMPFPQVPATAGITMILRLMSFHPYRVILL